jgi:hypothetical protein
LIKTFESFKFRFWFIISYHYLYSS